MTLVMVSVLSPVAINIIVPSMPSIQRAYATDYSTVQLTLSLYLAAIALTQVVIGPLSDRFGRRPVLLAGISIFIVASLAAVISPNIESLIVLRVIQAAGGCTGLVLGRAIIRDVYDRRKAASMIGYVTMAFAVGPMVSPLIGGLLQDMFDWRAQFYFLAALGTLALFTTWHWIGETNANPTPKINFVTMFRDFRSLVSRRTFVLFTAISSLASGLFFSFLGSVSYVTETLLAMKPTEFGFWFMLVAIGYSTGNFFSGRYAEVAGVRRMILIGSLLALVAVASMTTAFSTGYGSSATLFGGMLVVAFSNGLVLPNSVAGAISVRPEIAGAAAGLSGALQMGTGALMATIAGIVIAGQSTALPVFGLMMFCAVAALACTIAILRTQR